MHEEQAHGEETSVIARIIDQMEAAAVELRWVRVAVGGVLGSDWTGVGAGGVGKMLRVWLGCGGVGVVRRVLRGVDVGGL